LKNTLLISIQSLGPKISEKLINHFITEENVILAIAEARISEISSIKGIGQKLALKIIQKFHSEGIYNNEILMTDDIIKIHKQIVNILKSYAQTQFIKDKFSLLYPLPASKIDVIKSRLNNYKQRILEFQKVDEDLIRKIQILFKKIKPFKPLEFKNRLILHRIIITNDQEEYNKLIDLDIEKYSKVLLVESFNEKLISYLNSFDLVIFISNEKIEDSFFNQIENAVVFDKRWDIIDLIPESVITAFSGPNYEVILASYKLMKILKQISNDKPILLKDFETIQIGNLNELIKNLILIDKKGEIIPGNNPEYDLCKNIVDNFDGIIADIEMKINESIEDEIKKSKAVLDGNQIFNLLQSIDESNSISLNALMEYLPLNIAEIIEEKLMEAREKLVEKLNLDDPNSSIVFELYSNDINFPIEADSFTLEKLKNNIVKREKFFKYQILTQIAKKLNKYKPLILQILKNLFYIDEILAVKSFMNDWNSCYPNFVNTTQGLSFTSGSNLFLNDKEDEIIPINYHIGNVPLSFETEEKLQGSDIVILTGANSGGKTTLLQTIAQITIMAQMGLPVAAKNVNIGAFDEIYYFSKNQGSHSSGAFEASLKHFTDVIVSNKTKLVLMDELEAITEPGAAAKVIGGILEMLAETKCSTTVLVSHLASQILKTIKTYVRIDGIEANGIENGKLIVDRNPKFNYLAKSMPFFIIQKLYESCSESDFNKKEIYGKMMQYFEQKLN